MPNSINQVVLTLSSQTVAGMVLYMTFSYSGTESGTRLLPGKTALALLLTGLLASLATLANYNWSAASGFSFLKNRELLYISLPAFFLAAWLLFRSRILLVSAAFGGICLVYAMSRIYPAIPVTQADSINITLPLFVASMMLLGPSTLFLIACLKNRRNPEGVLRQALGWHPVAISLAFVLRMLVLFIQCVNAGPSFAARMLWLQAALLLLGAGPMLLLVVRSPFIPVRDETGEFRAGALLAKVGLMTALLWAGEICGRIALYSTSWATQIQ